MITILLPTDASEFAARAYPYAVRLARDLDAQLTLLFAAGPKPTDHDIVGIYNRELRAVTADLERAAEELRQAGVRVMMEVVHEDPSDAISHGAASCDLIVMSTHGRSGLGRWMYGSVADAVIHRTDTPLLLVPSHAASAWPADRGLSTLIALDGGEFSRQAIPVVTRLLVAPGRGELILASAVELSRAAMLTVAAGIASPGYVPEDFDAQPVLERKEALETLAAELQAQGLAVRVRVDRGFAAEAICRMAREDGASVIAMTTHARAGLARLVLGSVTTGVVQMAPVPVLLVHPKH